MAIGWNRLNLQFVGAWPDPIASNGRFTKYRSLIAGIFIVCGLVAPQSANLFLIWGDLELVTENLSTANIPAMNAFMKLVFIRYHQTALRPLIKSFYDDWTNVKTKEERETMLNVAKITKNISIWCSVLTQVMVTLFIGLRTFNVANSDRNKENQDHLVLYPGYIPYNVRPTPILIVTNLCQAIGAYCGTVAYTGVDSFIAMIILHTCGQFKNLRRKLERIIDDDERTKDSEEIQKELASIVKRHEHLEWVATSVESCFNMLLLLQLLLCTIQLCFQGFMTYKMVLESEDGIPAGELLFFVFFVTVIIVHVYIYCYIGELLIVQSSGMGNSAYESSWFNVSPSNAKCLIFIMHKSIRPLRLTAGKFATFSMELFSSILRTSMGYLSVLLTVANGAD